MTREIWICFEVVKNCCMHFTWTHEDMLCTSQPLAKGDLIDHVPSGENFVNPLIRHLSPFLDQGLSPPPAEVRPRKFEKFKYIFVSNLTTFKLESTLKSCISCLK